MMRQAALTFALVAACLLGLLRIATAVDAEANRAKQPTYHAVSSPEALSQARQRCLLRLDRELAKPELRFEAAVTAQLLAELYNLQAHQQTADATRARAESARDRALRIVDAVDHRDADTARILLRSIQLDARPSTDTRYAAR